MRTVLLTLTLLAATMSHAQGHDLKPAEALKALAFMKGDWKGKQEFVTGGDPMVGEARNTITDAIGGRYLEERLAVTLPGRPASDTRHFITYDPKSSTYKAWWFNDSAVGAMEFEGRLEGGRLVMSSKPTSAGGSSVVFRVTYSAPTEGQLQYVLEMKQGEAWQKLFTTTYSK